MQKTFVLVHGAWSGQYAWAKVRLLLEEAGHRVVTFDLPGHADDQTPREQITLATYVAATIQHIEAEVGRVVLGGHGMAGMIISQVAEYIPDRIEQLVYLCAYLPHDGQRVIDFQDPDSLLPPNLVVSKDHRMATIKPESIVPIFATDCAHSIQELIVARHRPEPLSPFYAPVRLTEANFGQVPKCYIETLHDVVITTSLQRQMLVANGTVAHLTALDCGHSPFFARPREVAAIMTGT